MKIIIEYDSCWRNSFLGGSNNEPVPKKGREFLGSMTNLKKEGNFKFHETTLNTVMGVLNRLIGDQRKLYQARNKLYEQSYYFENLEDKVSFTDKAEKTNEITFIRNMNGSKDQQSFTGMVKADDPVFTSGYSKEFLGVLKLNPSELCDFILDSGFVVNKEVRLSPLYVADLVDEIVGMGSVENVNRINEAVELLTNKYSDLVTDKVPTPYIESNGKVKLIRLYSAGLYIQLERLRLRFDMTSSLSPRGSISGFSKRGYNGRRDFMNKYTTGKPKLIWGNPFIKKEKIKGQGEVTSMMTKANGQLEIIIDVDRTKGHEIKTMIENAGVSSFYLGKKGLAYVSSIRA